MPTLQNTVRKWRSINRSISEVIYCNFITNTTGSYNVFSIQMHAKSLLQFYNHYNRFVQYNTPGILLILEGQAAQGESLSQKNDPLIETLFLTHITRHKGMAV